MTIRFPITAIVSILHRLSGVFLFLLIPLFLSVLADSLKTPENFLSIHHYLSQPASKLVLLVIFFALFYHMFAGIRHLLMDAGVGEKLTQARVSAVFTLLAAVTVTALLGVRLW